jgi:hypothetical protein
MSPRWAPGEFAEDQDDPFARVWTNGKLKKGSYGIQVDLQLESLQKIKETQEFTKAVKADDAEILVYLWNDRIRSPGIIREEQDAALTRFRKLGHQVFMRGLVCNCTEYMQQTYDPTWGSMPQRSDGTPTKLGQDRETISGILWHTTHTNWFVFHAGSWLVHLCFPIQCRTMARDGVPVWFEKPGPATCEAQSLIADPALRAKAKEKIIKVVRRRYLGTTDLNIKSLIKYFAIPKGKDNVRMVHDATANQLNDCVWVPTFWLPMIDLLVRALDENSWMTDQDVGNMFLNFQLHRTAAPYTGMDLLPLYKSDADAGPWWVVWDRNLMGFVASPYNSIKMALVAKEICRGDRYEQGLGSDGKELNFFQWDMICLNLPGSKDFDPTKTWISKIRADGRVACDLFTFVDDEQVEEEQYSW